MHSGAPPVPAEDDDAELDVTVETRGRDHLRELVAALKTEGFTVRVLEV